MKVEITRLSPTAILPEYQTASAAAMDIHACLDQPVVLRPMQRQMIPSGFAIALPDGFEAQIRARSGLSIKHGITMVNGVGTIDADYRGEVGILMINLGQEPFEILPAMRIAQMVVTRYEQVQWREVVQLEHTDRGFGGFGSTGEGIN